MFETFKEGLRGVQDGVERFKEGLRDRRGVERFMEGLRGSRRADVCVV